MFIVYLYALSKSSKCVVIVLLDLIRYSVIFDEILTLFVRGGLIQPPLQNIALNQDIWGPGTPKLIDFS